MKRVLCTGMGLLISFLCFFGERVGIFDPLELESIDHRYHMRPREKVSNKKVLLLYIDDKESSSEELNLIIRDLVDGGARIIVFDTSFIERDELIRPFHFDARTRILYPVRFIFRSDDKEPSWILMPYTDLYNNIQQLFYHTNLFEDRDGVLRRMPPSIEYRGRKFPPLQLLVASEYLGRRINQVDESIMINYYEDDGFEEVIPGKDHPSINGKIVVVGGRDTIQTPFGERPIPWVYGTMITNILEGDILRSIPDLSSLFVVLSLGGVIGLIVATKGPIISFLSSIVIISGYILITYMSAKLGLFMNLTTPLISSIFCYLGTTILRYGIEERRLSISLAKTKLYNQGVVECMSSGLIVLDEDGRIVTLNKRGGCMIGIDNAQGLLYQEVLEDGRFKDIIEAALIHSIPTMDEEVNLGDRVLLVSAAPIKGEKGVGIGAMAVFQEITEIKNLEKRLAFKERLASIGELSAKIAHEFRNPIGAIRSSAKILERGLKGNKYIEIILDECRNIERLIDEFLSFARPQTLKKTKIPLNILIEDAIGSILSDGKGEGISIKKDYDKDIDLEVDVARIKRAIMNIIQNGIEAMDGRGELEVRADVVSGFARITIRDKGPGIKREEIKMIFEPFFTTKDGGTGLGLAISHNIIEAHNGRIECESEPGKGATFYIYLPMEV